MSEQANKQSYTLQEAFDKAVSGVLSQRGSSVETSYGISVCVVRSPEGRKCAFGYLVTDEQIQRYNINGGVHSCPPELFTELFGEENRVKGFNLAYSLQRAHDVLAFKHSVPEFQVGFAKLAREEAIRFNLSTAVLDKDVK